MVFLRFHSSSACFLSTKPGDSQIHVASSLYVFLYFSYDRRFTIGAFFSFFLFLLWNTISKMCSNNRHHQEMLPVLLSGLTVVCCWYFFLIAFLRVWVEDKFSTVIMWLKRGFRVNCNNLESTDDDDTWGGREDETDCSRTIYIIFHHNHP